MKHIFQFLIAWVDRVLTEIESAKFTIIYIFFVQIQLICSSINKYYEKLKNYKIILK